MKREKVLSLVLAFAFLVSGCNRGKAETTEQTVLSGVAGQTATSDVTETSVTETTATETFEFNPHVYSGKIAERVPQDYWDSFYNLSEKPLYDKKQLSVYETMDKKDKDVKEAIKVLKKKEENRKEFFADLKKVVADDSWVIIFTEHLRTKENQVDFHFVDCLKDGSASTVSDQNTFMRLFEQFTETMKDEFSLTSMLRSPRYPLLKKNLGYKIRKDIANANVFVLRPSSELMNFNDRKLAIAYRMATIISQQLDGGRGIQEKDVEDFKETGFGYSKNEESESIKTNKI